jgi:magnesium and cobalt transporter
VAESTSPRSGWWERLLLALGGEPRTRAELLELLEEAHANRLFDADALAMIQGALRVSEREVRDVMIPRAQMVVVREDDALGEVLATVSGSGHSRYPVVRERRDDVLGLLLAKDLLEHYLHRSRRFRVRDYLRPVLFVPEGKALNQLLREFRTTRNHMAMAVDEHGAVSGLITLEDILEEIVGEIDDEHDLETEATIVERSPTRFTVNGLTTLEAFNRRFGTALRQEGVSTLGGYVAHRLGRIPIRGEELELEGARVRVLRADGRRVHLLDVRWSRPPVPGAAAPSAPGRDGEGV